MGVIALKKMRLKAGLTCLRVTEKMGFKRKATIYEYESGVCEPNFPTLVKFAKLYNCSLDDFIPDDKNEAVS